MVRISELWSVRSLCAIGCVAAVATLSTQKAQAEDFIGDLAFAVTAGTGGVGAEATLQHVGGLSALDLRVAAEGFGLDHNVDYDGIAYSGRLNLADAGAYLDLHPIQGFPLVASLGVQTGRRRLKIHAVPSAATVVIGGVTYSTASAGALDGSVSLSDVTPYAGLGWRQSLGKRLFIKLDLGAAFGSKPKVTLTSTSPLVAETDLAAERAKIASDAKILKTYPVATVGVGWRF
jgi:hypothetical protein